jgi:hypothetical protein
MRKLVALGILLLACGGNKSNAGAGGSDAVATTSASASSGAGGTAPSFTLTAGPKVKIGPAVTKLAAKDLNGDGFTDIVAVNNPKTGMHGITVVLSTGKDTFGAPKFYAWATKEIVALDVHDLNADGKPEIIFVDELAVAKNDGGGSFFAPQQFPVNTPVGGRVYVQDKYPASSADPIFGGFRPILGEEKADGTGQLVFIELDGSRTELPLAFVPRLVHYSPQEDVTYVAGVAGSSVAYATFKGHPPAAVTLLEQGMVDVPGTTSSASFAFLAGPNRFVLLVYERYFGKSIDDIAFAAGKFLAHAANDLPAKPLAEVPIEGGFAVGMDDASVAVFIAEAAGFKDDGRFKLAEKWKGPTASDAEQIIAAIEASLANMDDEAVVYTLKKATRGPVVPDCAWTKKLASGGGCRFFAGDASNKCDGGHYYRISCSDTSEGPMNCGCILDTEAHGIVRPAGICDLMDGDAMQATLDALWAAPPAMMPGDKPGCGWPAKPE